MTGSPLVSICIPVRNGAGLIGQAIESALAQTHETLEVLVVDNRSTDATQEVVRAFGDPRIRLEVNAADVGPVGNHTRCVELARGDYVKFLHHDDLLHAECVDSMQQLLAEHPSVGFVFAPREILLDDPHDPDAKAWRDRYSVLHTGFGSLEPVNPGPSLIERYLPAFRAPPIENWIGEPTSVMVRRSCFDRVGLFNPKIKQAFELDMWLRLMGTFDVGFVERPLTVFRHHPASLSARTARVHDNWLDRLWIFEDLLGEPGYRPWHPLIRSFRRRELARVLKTQLARIVRGNPDPRPLAQYLAYRAGRRG